MRIWVIMGGMSAEREVSLESGHAVVAALRDGGHEVWTYELREGRFLPPLCTAGVSLPPEGRVPEEAGRARGWAETLLTTAAWIGREGAEVAFLALHGDEGEDGRIQALLGAVGFPYTGSGPAASAIAMDKVLTKRVMESLGIPTPAWTLVEVPGGTPSPGHPALPAQDVLAATPVGGLPVVIKPIAQGSSVGVSIVSDAPGWAPGLAEAAAASRREGRRSIQLLVEEYIEGMELTVGVLGERPLPVVEIRPVSGFYDYRRKYTPGQTTYDVPAQIDSRLAGRLQERALLLYKALGCRAVARIDFRASSDGRDYCLELNTIPGLTSTSLIPKACAAVGIGFLDMLEQICRDAIAS